jgi:cobyrinic acid a,c-diamide synthase
MNTYKTPRLFIGGTSKGCGKSLFAISLAIEYRRRNLSVSCAVVGPALSQSIIFRRLTRRYVRVIDTKILSKEQIMFSLDQAMTGADILIIDGRNALFDGLSSLDNLVSDSLIAELTGTPVILVADTRRVSESVGAVVRGFSLSANAFDIGGVVYNRIDGLNNSSFYKNINTMFSLPTYVGSFPEFSHSFTLPKSPGYQTGSAVVLPREFFLETSDYVQNNFSIDESIALATSAAPLALDTSKDRRQKLCTIAVAEDPCFGICVQDNLEMLRYYGAQIETFSPLADTSIPDNVQCLYFPGAFLAEYAESLVENVDLYKSIQAFVQAGGVVFSEGGGTAFLCQQFCPSLNGAVYDGVGIFPGFAEAVSPNQYYYESEVVADTLFGGEGVKVKGINTGEWHLRPNPGLHTSLKVKGIGNASSVTSLDGWGPSYQILGTFGFNHFGSNRTIAKNFVDNVARARIKV